MRSMCHRVPFIGVFLWGTFFPFIVIFFSIFHPLNDDVLLRVFHHRLTNGVIFAIAVVAFLCEISSLGMVNFGGHRMLFFIFCVTLSTLALFANYGFLGVRGLAIMELLWTNYVLNSLAGNYACWCIAMKVWVYVIIVGSLYFVCAPYGLRDLLLRKRK